jgi:hypothetical protein
MDRSDPKKCCILVPSRNGIDPACEAALHELARRGYSLRIMRGVTSIDQIRCQMACDALDAGFEELFWIDDDIVFNPDDVDRLRAANLPIIGGVYPRKGEPVLAIRWKEGTNTVVLGDGGGLVEVKYASTGFLCTRAAVYDAMQVQGLARSAIGQFGRSMMGYFQPMTIVEGSVTRYLAEDWSFCHRLAQAGIPIHVDTRPRLLHIGRYAYSWDDLIPREPMASLTVQLD